MESASTSKVTPIKGQARIYTRDEHPISRRNISDSALKVLYRLNKAGYRSCLVGGAVRDLMLGREPKDFDIATDALPEQVRELFRNSRLIGRRFRLAHVRFGREIIEVATFRAAHDGESEDARVTDEGRILRDNVYGDIDQDVWRRDFTVNALYYDINGFSVIDYVGGVADLHAGRIRLIGDPQTRYREDPLRMLRAVRFATKLGFEIEAASAKPFGPLGYLLEQLAPARLFDEVLKLFHGGCGKQSFEALRHFDLFKRLFPQTDECLTHMEGGFPDQLLSVALNNTDERVQAGKPVTPAFLFAAFLWCTMEERRMDHEAQGVANHDALNLAADAVISQQVARIAVPRRVTQMTRDIWSLQGRLNRRSRRRSLALLENPRFRAAYDFLLLRAQAGEPVGELADWWTAFQEVDHEEKLVMLKSVEGGKSGGRRSKSSHRS